MTETLIGGSSETVTFADTRGSATLVAVTDAVVAVLTEGAVYRPVLEIAPLVADQVTPFLVAPVTVPLNCWVFPEFTVTLAGVIETTTGGVTVTVALADLVGSATLVAVTVTVVFTVTTGAR